MIREKSSQPRVFVALGDGLAAGFGPWHLTSMGRKASFPARVARRLGVAFELPPTSVAMAFRSKRRTFRLPHHLTIPRFSFTDVVERRSTPPFEHPQDPLANQTNLVLGLPFLIEPQAQPSLLEGAASHRPTHTLFCLGFDQVLAAIRAGDENRLPTQQQIERVWEPLTAALGSAKLVIATVPDPLRGACPRLGKELSSGLRRSFRAGIDRLNDQLAALAHQSGASLFELHEFMAEGAAPREVELFWGVDGLYPSYAGHRLIADKLLTHLDTPWDLDLDLEPEDLTATATLTIPTVRAPRALQETTPWSGLKLASRSAESAKGFTKTRDLSLELNADASFCQLALVPDPSNLSSALREPDIHRLLGGPAMGVAPLRGLVDLSLGAPGPDGLLPIALEFSTPLRSQGGTFAAVHMLHESLGDLKLRSHGPMLGHLDPTTGKVHQASSALSLESDLLRRIAANNQDAPEATTELLLSLPQRQGRAASGAVHVELQIHGTWPLGTRVRLPIEGDPAVRSAALKIFIRLTTRLNQEQVERLPSSPLPKDKLELTALATLNTRYALEAHSLGGQAADPHRLCGRLRLHLGQPEGLLTPALISLRSPTPSSLGTGLLGFDGEVRFPNRLWRRQTPSLVGAEEPALGVIDGETGRLLGGLRLAVRSNGLPPNALGLFQTQGQLLDDGNQLRLELTGNSTVKLETGTPFRLSGANDALDGPSEVEMSLHLEAIGDHPEAHGCLSGEERLLSSNRQLFSFRYVLPTEPGERTLFEYTNHTKPGTFMLTCPIRLRFSRRPASSSKEEPDTVVLEGLGSWNGECPDDRPHGLHHVFFFLRRAHDQSYVAVLIDGGRTSNAEAGNVCGKNAAL